MGPDGKTNEVMLREVSGRDGVIQKYVAATDVHLRSEAHDRHVITDGR
jgi:hypothetical protein